MARRRGPIRRRARETDDAGEEGPLRARRGVRGLAAATAAAWLGGAAAVLGPAPAAAAPAVRTAAPPGATPAARADTSPPAARADTTPAAPGTVPPRRSSPRYLLDTLVVSAAGRTGGRAAATRDLEVLGRDAIEATPARTVAGLLRWAAGVDVRPRSPAQADLSLRGSSFEQVLVLVDGVPVNDPQTGHFDLDVAVPLASVERIEILRGPASATFGADAVGGVVNIVTRGA
ncbi:MAG TPA: TonB-dependent receptor plug domain-containing protein, partial [Gemmatimonadota bacterium]|nr:TonB-dependent receptor plug domain-containing protein [Gemmatimonadota bacterium]